MMYAETRSACEAKRKRFRAQYPRCYPQGASRLWSVTGSAWELLRLPEPHWLHLRTTNIVERPIGTAGYRTPRELGEPDQIATTQVPDITLIPCPT